MEMNSDLELAKARLNNILSAKPIARLPKIISRPIHPIDPVKPIHFKPSPIEPIAPRPIHFKPSPILPKPVRGPVAPIHKNPIHVKPPIKLLPDDLNTLLPDQTDSISGSSSGSSAGASPSTDSTGATPTPDAAGSASSSTTPFSSDYSSSSSDGSLSSGTASGNTASSDISGAPTNDLSSASSEPATQRLLDLLGGSPAAGAASASAFTTADVDATAPAIRNNVLDAMMGSSSPSPRIAMPNVSDAVEASTSSASSSSPLSDELATTINSSTSGNYGFTGGTQVILPDDTVTDVVGDPTSLEAPLPTMAPSKSIGDQIASYGGIASGALQMAMFAGSKMGLLPGIFGSSGIFGSYTVDTTNWAADMAGSNVAIQSAKYIKLAGGILGAATAALSAYSLFNGLQDMFQKGFSWSGLLNVGMSFVGMALGLVQMLSMQIFAHFLALIGLSAGPAGWIIAGVVLAVMVIWNLLNGVTANTTPSALDQPLTSYPSVWSTGPVLFVTAGAALMTMGINLSPTAPTMQILTVPDVALTSTLNNSGLTTPGGNSATVTGGSGLYGTTFVQQGSGTTPDKVMIVSPNGSNGTDTVNVYTLNNNLHFASPSSPTGAYIPFMLPGSNTINPAAIQAVHSSGQLSQAAAALANPVAQERSAAVNKNDKATAGQ